MKSTSVLLVAGIGVFLYALISCKSRNDSGAHRFGNTLRDYAHRASQTGSHEALVPYASDEEEGEMLELRNLDEALECYEWIVGEPIEEKVVAFSRTAGSTAPDSISTVYRFRFEKRLGKSKYQSQPGPLETRLLRDMSIRPNEILVIKSGGNTVVDGVLLKKRGSLCFSELMPRRYLLALQMDTSNRIGVLAMGCRSIFAIDGDRLSPRQTNPEVVTAGIQERFGGSMAALSKALQGLATR